MDNGERHCGYGGSEQTGTCGVFVIMPACTAAGTWSVTSIQLRDSAGNAATTTLIDAAPIVVTSNNAVSSRVRLVARGLTLTPVVGIGVLSPELGPTTVRNRAWVT